MPQAKVLIVDDDANIRTVLRDALGSEPYTLLEAADGQHALQTAIREQPDLILLDIMLPGMDGDLVLRKLKENEKTRSIPVIMVTALTLDTQVSACLDDGATDHIGKPFSNMVVRSRVRAALRSRIPGLAADSRRATQQGRVLAFMGVKGGVGTTTVALNVALALLDTKKTVIAAEIRSHAGTIAAQLGASSAMNTDALLRDSPSGGIDSETLSRFLTHHPTGLRLLLAPPDMDEERELTSQQAEEIVRGLAGMADYVVLDIPADPPRIAKAAVRCCQFIALVVEPDHACLAAAPAMVKALESWGVSGPSMAAVLVQHIADTSTMTVNYLRSHLACPLVGVIPPAPELCAQALRA
jgi:DNA-binding response OmpR family regulator